MLQNNAWVYFNSIFLNYINFWIKKKLILFRFLSLEGTLLRSVLAIQLPLLPNCGSEKDMNSVYGVFIWLSLKRRSAKSASSHVNRLGW